jgi:predicted type IV restriction endonuclease
MVALNLPKFEVQLQKSNDKVWIFDVIRKKYVVLTPEEWVRQHLVNYFISHLQYPKSLMKIESGLRYNQLQKRTDVVVYNRDGNPWLVAECKSFEVELTAATLQQVAVYNASLGAQYLVVTNGVKHICFKPMADNAIEQLKDFPTFI